jgi:hypothetical protein
MTMLVTSDWGDLVRFRDGIFQSLVETWPSRRTALNLAARVTGERTLTLAFLEALASLEQAGIVDKLQGVPRGFKGTDMFYGLVNNPRQVVEDQSPSPASEKGSQGSAVITPA